MSVFDLTPSEKLQLVQDLWDDLASGEEGSVPVLESHLKEADRREARLEANPELGLTWDEVKRNIRRDK